MGKVVERYIPFGNTCQHEAVYSTLGLCSSPRILFQAKAWHLSTGMQSRTRTARSDGVGDDVIFSPASNRCLTLLWAVKP